MPASLTPERSVTGKKRNRNAFVRTKVPVTERVISVGIICLLAGIGIAIGIKGRHFDPNLYSLRTDALNSTASAVDGKAGTLRERGAVQPGEEAAAAPQPAAKSETAKPAAGETDSGEGSGEGAGSAAPKAVAKGEPLEINLPGIKPMGATEFYNADNLFEKIDGRAPAYLSFNFQQLRSRSFEVEKGGGSFVDVYEYRMDTPVNAFGIFSLERDPKGAPFDFATDGYGGEMGFFFRQGACYVQVIASDRNPRTMELAKAIAENRAKTLPADDSGLAGRRRLPADGMAAGSVTFVQENAQGQNFLKDVFQATYNFDGKKLPFFLMVATPEAAAEAWKSYRDFCGRFGKSETLPDVEGGKIFKARVFGKWKVIYQRENEIGGVIDAEEGETARRFVESYLKGNIK